MRIVFTQSTGLGDHVAEVGDLEENLPKWQALEFIRSGRAMPARDEEVPAPSPLTTDNIAPSPKEGGKP